MRFNPPPSWPTPPQGWTPPAGWEPDPAWGPPPSGWPLWVDDATQSLAPAEASAWSPHSYGSATEWRTQSQSQGADAPAGHPRTLALGEPLLPQTVLVGGAVGAALLVAVLTMVWFGIPLAPAQFEPATACEQFADLDARLDGAGTNEAVEYQAEYTRLLGECVDSGGPLPWE